VEDRGQRGEVAGVAAPKLATAPFALVLGASAPLIQCHPGIETSSSANMTMIVAAPRAKSASSRLRMLFHPLAGDTNH
jgi:hypothetical protein